MWSLSFDCFPADKPKIKSWPSSTAVNETDNVTLAAVVEGNPAPHVAWVFRKESVLQNKTGGFNYTITKITREQNGTYQCIAMNHLGSDREDFVINVQCRSSLCSWIGVDL